MCDYSLTACTTRDTEVSDELVSGPITNQHGSKTMTRGFHAPDRADVAVCLRPGTELSFDRPVEYSSAAGLFFPAHDTIDATTAIFREINEGAAHMHHDALEFPDGTIVLVHALIPGQRARVLQLPATVKRFHAEDRVPEELTSY